MITVSQTQGFLIIAGFHAVWPWDTGGGFRHCWGLTRVFNWIWLTLRLYSRFGFVAAWDVAGFVAAWDGR